MRVQYIVAVLSLISVTAYAQNPAAPVVMTASRLYEFCAGDTPASNIPVCTAYIGGITDLISVLTIQGASTGICIPSGMTLRQAVLAFQKYVNQNPEVLTYQGKNVRAADVVVSSLRQTFPCHPFSN